MSWDYNNDAGDWENYLYDFGKFSGDDAIDLQNLPDVVGSAGTPRDLLYSNNSYGPGMTGEQTLRYDTTLDLTGSKTLANIAASGNWSDLLKSIGGAGKDFLTSKAGIAGLMALLAYLDRQKSEPQGGGTTQAYAGPSKPLTSQMAQGKYGPIRTYAAQGGIMHAYANGGAVRPFPMQDGGFVMTGDAVRGAGGQKNLRRILPEAKPIVGPGTATSDSIPAYIRGPNGTTPAKVSNGEAYVPPGRNTKGLYALMRELERNA